jgi:hypothetical protein
VSEPTTRYWFMVRLDFTEPSKEAEFGAWYERHLQELAALPGFIRAYRLQVEPTPNARGEPGQTYVAMYELESMDAWNSLPAGRPPFDGLWLPYIKNWTRTFYKEVARA